MTPTQRLQHPISTNTLQWLSYSKKCKWIYSNSDKIMDLLDDGESTKYIGIPLKSYWSKQENGNRLKTVITYLNPLDIALSHLLS